MGCHTINHYVCAWVSATVYLLKTVSSVIRVYICWFWEALTPCRSPSANFKIFKCSVITTIYKKSKMESDMQMALMLWSVGISIHLLPSGRTIALISIWLVSTSHKNSQLFNNYPGQELSNYTNQHGRYKLVNFEPVVTLRFEISFMIFLHKLFIWGG